MAVFQFADYEMILTCLNLSNFVYTNVYIYIIIAFCIPTFTRDFIQNIINLDKVLFTGDIDIICHIYPAYKYFF